MSFYQDFKNTILDITEDNFSDRSLALFDYQYHTNKNAVFCKHPFKNRKD